jgi:hypothetical protein
MQEFKIASLAVGPDFRLCSSSTRGAAENLEHALAELQCGVPLRRLPMEKPHDGLPEFSELFDILRSYAAFFPWQCMLW